MRYIIFVLLIALHLSCATKEKSKEETDTKKASIAEENAKSNQPYKSAVAFVYHRFGNNTYPSTNTSVADFREHLNYLKNHDYEVLTASEALAYLKSDQENRKVAVLTIDDGFTTFYTNALPLLKEFGFKATLYINSETVGGGSYMNWDQIKEAHDYGIEIGNHTHSHAYFMNETGEERYKKFKEDIRKCQKAIKNNLKVEATSFAYPYGEFDPEMKEIIAKEGFDMAFAQNSGVMHDGSDVLQLPRFPAASIYGKPEKFKERIKMEPLVIFQQEPESFELPADNEKPTLELTFNKEDLQLNQLQCFVQGVECATTIEERQDGVVAISVQSKSALEARRQLYTITVPDSEGNWHWFSHLWVNPNLEE